MLTATRRTVLTLLACCGCSGLFDQSTRAPATTSPWKLAIGLNGLGSSQTHHGKRSVYEAALLACPDCGLDQQRLRQIQCFRKSTTRRRTGRVLESVRDVHYDGPRCFHGPPGAAVRIRRESRAGA